MKTEIRIDGDAKIARLFKLLPDSQPKALRKGLSAAASVVSKSAKSFAPVETKALKKAVGTKTITYRGSDTVVAMVGVRRGFQFAAVDRYGRKRVPAFYQHLVQRGTKPHSLSSAVDMKALTRGRSVFSDLAQQEFTVDGLLTGRKRTILARARGLARDYLLRRDSARGGRVHPGARANPFLAKAWAASGQAAVGAAIASISATLRNEANRLAA